MVTHTFSFRPSRDPAPLLRSPFKSRLSFPLSIAWVSGWVLLFRVWTRSFFRFYLWFLVPPNTPLTFSSIFFFIFSSFWFLSICSTRTVPPPEPQPRWKLTSFCFRWDHSAPTARERSQTPPPPTKRSKSFLSGSSYVYVCVCVCLWKEVGQPRRNGRGFLNMI